MDWNSSNSKWDWDNIVPFGSKPISGSPKKMIVDAGGPDNLLRFGGYNSAGHNSSGRSSISDSPTQDWNLSRKMDYSPPLEASSVGSGEPLIGLKLGKRTYFENNATFTVMPTPLSPTTPKKNKSISSQNASVCCQVEGCNVDLSGAKDYHRKHRVCDIHSKFPKVIVGGLERRFCQQCSRFHSLCEFDEKKRSCRRRLSDHNARRRKPQPDTIQFNSTRRLSSPFYGRNQKMGFLLNNDPSVYSSGTPPANSMWDRVSNHKFTLTKGYPLKSNGDANTDGGQLYAPRIKFRHPINVQNGANGLLATKNCTSEVFNPGGSLVFSSSQGASPDRALSLLSSNSWESCEPEAIPSHNLMHESVSNIAHSMVHAIPEAVPLSSAEFWLNGHQSMHSNIQSLAASSNFQEFQLFKSPYEADFYPGILN